MDLTFWRDVAIVVLAVEVFLFAIIPLVLMFIAVRGIRWGETRVREYAARFRQEWRKVHRHVERWMKTVRTPFEYAEYIVHLFK